MNNNAVTIPLECRALPGIQRALYTTMALFCATEKTITQYGELERGQWAGNWRDLVELTDASIHQYGMLRPGWQERAG